MLQIVIPERFNQEFIPDITGFPLKTCGNDRHCSFSPKLQQPVKGELCSRFFKGN